MSKSDLAQLISGAAVVLLTAVLAFTGRRDKVATADVTYTLADQRTTRTIKAGNAIPSGEGELPKPELVKDVKRSWLGAIVAGTDHRASTSKTVVFAWTLAVAFGLLSLLVAAWLGDHAPWDAQVKKGLQEEYLLLLGGPYAAAVLAKYATTSQADTKTAAPVGDASAAQLVNNDSGDTDLGDFQYVLFNVIALTFFLGDFIGDLAEGFPVLPAILTGLVLTSTGGYAAKKLLAQAAPTLTSVLPSSAAPDSSIEVFGANLTTPGSTSDDDTAVGQLPPTVFIGSFKATVATHDFVLGNDRLTLTVPTGATPGSAPITAVRADGSTARGPSGTNALPFQVLPKPSTAAGA